jgi:hypothetical protein
VLASAELNASADDIRELVKVIDGYNRFRFGQDPELLRGWRSASNIVGPPQPAGDGEGGEVKPAA